MKIEFLGNCADTAFTDAVQYERATPMNLTDFYVAVNQETEKGCCSCCKNQSKIYAVYSYINDIVGDTVGLCLDCIRKLPEELDVVNLYANGAPPRLHIKDR